MIIAASAEIDVAALQYNLLRIRQLAPNSQVLAVLKANAYGHGLVEIATELRDVEAFGVARLDEAIVLREGGITKPIVLLEGFFNPQELPILASNSIQTVVHSPEQIEQLVHAKLPAPIAVWLKVDTGMHRLGVTTINLRECYERLYASANVQKPIIVMTHFSCADDLYSDITSAQMQTFFDATQSLIGSELSLANSAGVIGWPASHANWIRPGLLMYGVSPLMQRSTAECDLKPVMTLRASLIAIQSLQKGDAVGYGAAWTASKPTRIGIISVGYGDGYPRHAKEGTPVLLAGKRVSIVGRVSMDMLTVDLGMDDCFNVGDEAILWGKGLAVEEIAECADTIPYELLCNVARRVAVNYSY